MKQTNTRTTEEVTGRRIAFGSRLGMDGGFVRAGGDGDPSSYPSTVQQGKNRHDVRDAAIRLTPPRFAGYLPRFAEHPFLNLHFCVTIERRKSGLVLPSRLAAIREIFPWPQSGC